jgi:Fe-S-cluster containining protein
MRPAERSPIASLAQKTDQWFQRANATLLSQVPCRAGCSQCCIGFFPITRLDVSLLQEGLSHLGPEQREAIQRRAREQVSALESAYPQLKASPSLDQWSDTTIDRVLNEFPLSPCPALEDGLCALYAHRPLTCRSMGIPTGEELMVQGACDVQTFVPIVRLSASLRAEEKELAAREAAELAALEAGSQKGEEMFLPYGFLDALTSESG